MLSQQKLSEIRERDAKYSDTLPHWWSCQYDRRLLLAEVDRLAIRVKELEEEEAFQALDRLAEW